MLYYALGGGKQTGGGAPCRERYAAQGTDEVRKKINAVDVRLTRVLNEVRHRATEASVLVVGYPSILPAKSSGCGREMGLAPGDVAYLNGKEQQLNTVLRARARAAGADYVDTYAPSVRREACSARDTRWVEPLVPLAPAAPVHPNERGERGMADAVLKALGAGE